MTRGIVTRRGLPLPQGPAPIHEHARNLEKGQDFEVAREYNQ